MEVRSKGTSEVRSEGKSEFLVAGASARAVDGLLGRLNVSGSSRRTLKRKQIQQVQESTVFGTPIRTIDLPAIGGGVVRWTGAAHPAAMLNHMAKTKGIQRYFEGPHEQVQADLPAAMEVDLLR